MTVPQEALVKLLIATRRFRQNPSLSTRRLFEEALEVVERYEREERISVIEAPDDFHPQQPLYGGVLELRPRKRPVSSVMSGVISGLVAAIVVIGFLFVLLNQPGRFPVVVPAQAESDVLITETSLVSTDVPICGGSERVPRTDSNFFRRDLAVNLFNVENEGVGVLNNTIRAIAIDEQGVWFGYYPQTGDSLVTGIGQFNRETWELCSSSDGALGQNTNDIAIDGQGNVWVATDGFGVDRYDGKEWRKYTTADGLPDNKTYTIEFSADGNVWVGTWSGVAKFDGAKWSVPYTVTDGTNLVDNHVDAIAFPPGGEIWIGYIEAGLSRFTADGEWVHYSVETTPNVLGSNAVRGIVIDNDNNVWIATAGGGISKFTSANQSWQIYTSSNSNLPHDNVRAIALDKYGRIWAATEGGVSYFNGSDWQLNFPIDALSIAFGPTCSECPYDDVHVWFGTVDQGLAHSRIPATSEVVQVVNVEYPRVVAPNQSFNPRITVRVLPGYDLREDRDALFYTGSSDANLFQAHPTILVKGVVDPGDTYTFFDYENPLIAPQEAGTYRSTWRVWQDRRYVGEEIIIEFTVSTSVPTLTPLPS